MKQQSRSSEESEGSHLGASQQQQLLHGSQQQASQPIVPLHLWPHSQHRYLSHLSKGAEHGCTTGMMCRGRLRKGSWRS